MSVVLESGFSLQCDLVSEAGGKKRPAQPQSPLNHQHPEPKTIFQGAFTMCSGILLLALPIALIGARFQEAYNMAVSSRPRGARVSGNFRQAVFQALEFWGLWFKSTECSLSLQHTPESYSGGYV